MASFGTVRVYAARKGTVAASDEAPATGDTDDTCQMGSRSGKVTALTTSQRRLLNSDEIASPTMQLTI